MLVRDSLTVVGGGIPYGWGSLTVLVEESLTEEIRKLDTDTPLQTIMILIWRLIKSLIMK